MTNPLPTRNETVLVTGVETALGPLAGRPVIGAPSPPPLVCAVVAGTICLGGEAGASSSEPKHYDSFSFGSGFPLKILEPIFL